MAGFSKDDIRFRSYALTADPLAVLLKAGFPLALYQALNPVFKLLDALMASQISSTAVSAVSCLSQITQMITALGAGLAVGGSIKISEAYGRGDQEQVQKLVATVYAMAVAVSIAVAVTLVPFAAPFLRLLRTPEDLIQGGLSYFRVEILTLVVSFFNTVYMSIERSRGHAKKIMWLNLGMLTIKLVLSAFFVYGLKGSLVLLAAASLIGQCSILVYALATMPRDDGAFRFTPKAIRMTRKLTFPVLNLAYPVSAEKMLFSAGKVIINSMSGLYGTLTVGALGISNNIGGLTTSWHVGFTDGTAPLISQNRGAGKYRRTLQFFYRLLALNIAIGTLGLVLVRLGLPWLASVFAQSKGNPDAEFREQIIAIHQWEMFGYITLGINSAVTTLLLGYGYTKLTLVLNVLRVFAYRVPVLWVLQRFTNLGAEAVGITMMVSNVCTGVTAAVIAVPVVLRIRRMIREEEMIQTKEETT